MSPQPKSKPRERRYEALRGGNYRKGGEDAVAGQVYSDIPEELVEDLLARHAIRDLSGISERGEGDA